MDLWKANEDVSLIRVPRIPQLRWLSQPNHRGIYSPFASLITNYLENIWYWSQRSGLLARSLPTRSPFSPAAFFSFSQENGIAGHLNRRSTTFACTILARNLCIIYSKINKSSKIGRGVLWRKPNRCLRWDLQAIDYLQITTCNYGKIFDFIVPYFKDK